MGAAFLTIGFGSDLADTVVPIQPFLDHCRTVYVRFGYTLTGKFGTIRAKVNAMLHGAFQHKTTGDAAFAVAVVTATAALGAGKAVQLVHERLDGVCIGLPLLRQIVTVEVIITCTLRSKQAL